MFQLFLLFCCYEALNSSKIPFLGKKGRFHYHLISPFDIINKNAAVVICPITDAFGKTSKMHVFVSKDQGGLTKDSIVHCGKIRSIDNDERIGNKIGDMPEDIMSKIESGIKWVITVP